MADPLLSKLSLGPPSGWDTERILPDGFLPMLASPASGPLDSADHAYEVKWEGLRVLPGMEGPTLAVRSGTGQDGRFWFPELEELRSAAEPRWILLDGEMVRLEQGRVSVGGLQQRLKARTPEEVSSLAESAPLTFMAYDILRIGDSWLLDVSWDERREILLRAVREMPHLRVAPTFRNGADALEHARSTGLESVIAKRLRGRYTPGEKTRDWLSIRPLETLDVVICGWMEGRGTRLGTIGSLVLGIRRGGSLEYVGHTGTGLDARTLHDLLGELKRRRRDRAPFVDPPAFTVPVSWVEPDLTCRVRIQGWNESGHLKGPTFLGLSEPVRSGA